MAGYYAGHNAGRYLRQRRRRERQQQQRAEHNMFVELLQRIVAQPQETKNKKYNDVPRYDGKTDYSVYQVQFVTLAEANGWTEQDKKTALLQALTGDATDAIANLQHQ
jgi:hypothetical protein